MTTSKDTKAKSGRKAAHDMTAAEKRAERDHRKSERAAGRKVDGVPDDDSDLHENTTGSVPERIEADPSGGANATAAGEGAGTEVNQSGAVYETSQPDAMGKNVNETGKVESTIPPQSTVPDGATPNQDAAQTERYSGRGRGRH